ncbi:uncharacterized protein LOC134068992 [Sardina pilchardus]|uniref:uncharacterized protein LOC134068992 n=1 Tax=Sardina pilchardus TaxID=27697 RepID=UPI002E10A07A
MSDLKSSVKSDLHSKTGATGTQSQEEIQPDISDLRIVLLGRCGSGKSTVGNKILGTDEFEEGNKTRECQRERAHEGSVIDTPGIPDEEAERNVVEEELMRCIELAEPGPHVFLFVVKLKDKLPYEVDAAEWIKEKFGEEALRFTIIVFTHSDKLHKPIEKIIHQSEHLSTIHAMCGGRYHVFNRAEVSKLMMEIINLYVTNEGMNFSNPHQQQEEEEAGAEQVAGAGGEGGAGATAELVTGLAAGAIASVGILVNLPVGITLTWRGAVAVVVATFTATKGLVRGASNAMVAGAAAAGFGTALAMDAGGTAVIRVQFHFGEPVCLYQRLLNKDVCLCIAKVVSGVVIAAAGSAVAAAATASAEERRAAAAGAALGAALGSTAAATVAVVAVAALFEETPNKVYVVASVVRPVWPTVIGSAALVLGRAVVREITQKPEQRRLEMHHNPERAELDAGAEEKAGRAAVAGAATAANAAAVLATIVGLIPEDPIESVNAAVIVVAAGAAVSGAAVAAAEGALGAAVVAGSALALGAGWAAAASASVAVAGAAAALAAQATGTAGAITAAAGGAGAIVLMVIEMHDKRAPVCAGAAVVGVAAIVAAAKAEGASAEMAASSAICMAAAGALAATAVEAAREKAGPMWAIVMGGVTLALGAAMTRIIVQRAKRKRDKKK